MSPDPADECTHSSGTVACSFNSIPAGANKYALVVTVVPPTVGLIEAVSA